MADVHFTTMPCAPNTAYKAQRKPTFYSICSCTKDIEKPRFEDFITFLCVFYERCQGFRPLRTWVNVPVAIFFLIEDCSRLKDLDNQICHGKSLQAYRSIGDD